MSSFHPSNRRFLLRRVVLRFPVVRAPQNAARASDKLTRTEGLGDVVVGADLETDDLLRRFAKAAHDDDADAEPTAQRTRQLEPVPAGQNDVDGGEIETAGLGELDRAGRCIGGGNFKTGAAQRGFYGRADQRIVIDDKNSFHSVSPAPATSNTNMLRCMPEL